MANNRSVNAINRHLALAIKLAAGDMTLEEWAEYTGVPLPKNKTRAKPQAPDPDELDSAGVPAWTKELPPENAPVAPPVAELPKSDSAGPSVAAVDQIHNLLGPLCDKFGNIDYAIDGPVITVGHADHLGNAVRPRRFTADELTAVNETVNHILSAVPGTKDLGWTKLVNGEARQIEFDPTTSGPVKKAPTALSSGYTAARNSMFTAMATLWRSRDPDSFHLMLTYLSNLDAAVSAKDKVTADKVLFKIDNLVTKDSKPPFDPAAKDLSLELWKAVKQDFKK